MGRLDVGCVPRLGLRTLYVLRQSADLQREGSLFQSPAAIGSNESQVFGGQGESDSLCLARFQGNLVEGTQPLVVGSQRCNEVTRIQQYGFLAGPTARILHIDADGQHIVGREAGLIHPQVTIYIRGVAQTIAEGPLQDDLGIVVVGTCHRSNLFAHLIVVVNQRVDFLGVGVRHLGREVFIAAEQVDQCVSTVVARQEDVDDAFGEGLDVGNEARTALVEHEFFS